VTTAEEILKRRLLAALEQVVGTREAPELWGGLTPENRNLRAAATVFERIAEASSRSEIIEELRRIAGAIEERRKERSEGEAAVFSRAAGAVEGLGTLEPETSGLLGLSLWRQAGVPVGRIQGAVRSALPEEVPVDEEVLTRAAQVLVRTRARAWRAKAHRIDREEKVP